MNAFFGNTALLLIFSYWDLTLLLSCASSLRALSFPEFLGSSMVPSSPRSCLFSCSGQMPGGGLSGISWLHFLLGTLPLRLCCSYLAQQAFPPSGFSTVEDRTGRRSGHQRILCPARQYCRALALPAVGVSTSALLSVVPPCFLGNPAQLFGGFPIMKSIKSPTASWGCPVT